MIEIAKLRPDERDRWSELWRGYLVFYGATLSEERHELTWLRLMAGVELMALGARLDGRLVGITHYLFHASTWMNDVCYVQDLYVDESCRGQGAGRRLIEAVAAAARARDAGQLYWMTQTGNAAARVLYDRIARFKGFIRYDYVDPG